MFNILNLAVQVAVLGVLIYYARDTHRIWRAAQEQAEGQHKPCLTLHTTAREPTEAILETGDAVGARTPATQEGNIIVENVGNGVALNVRYQFKQITPSKDGVTMIQRAFFPIFRPARALRSLSRVEYLPIKNMNSLQCVRASVRDDTNRALG